MGENNAVKRFDSQSFESRDDNPAPVGNLAPVNQYRSAGRKRDQNGVSLTDVQHPYNQVTGLYGTRQQENGNKDRGCHYI